MKGAETGRKNTKNVKQPKVWNLGLIYFNFENRFEYTIYTINTKKPKKNSTDDIWYKKNIFYKKKKNRNINALLMSKKKKNN